MNKKWVNKDVFSTKLLFPSYIMGNEKKNYQTLHDHLPQIKKNQLNIVGADLQIDNLKTVKVTAFIRSTLKKTIRIKPTKIILLDKNLIPIAEKEVDFTSVGNILPNTAKPLIIEFSSKDIKKLSRDSLENWSLAFKSNFEHYIDFSDFNKSDIPKSTKKWLNELAQKETLDQNELSFVGFSAKRDESNNLLVNLLIRNGTVDDLIVKQLPLKFYDASKELAAKGTFHIENMTVRANTSKPITLVFPITSILKKDMDLSSWSISHNE